MKVFLGQPRGFCAGVVRGIDIVELALERFGPPVYVKHQIVHNAHVVEALRKKGAVTIEEIDEAPSGPLSSSPLTAPPRRTTKELKAEGSASSTPPARL
jgi:4-hydroxy-3-methylbut-2-enyl diphosphate reductase